ncbi:transposase [Plakobranchus ocellatus]|uniref:Transposase n=1 Tax=Plakobranchus ocellatus TaxID=259542 RepID=A0AAV4AV20_9GAST|nr:transposase [Plakobranchus ocellatus]
MYNNPKQPRQEKKQADALSRLSDEELCLTGAKGTAISDRSPLLPFKPVLTFGSSVELAAAFLTFTWKFGEALCKLVNYAQHVSMICSILTLTTISLERGTGCSFSNFKYFARIRELLTFIIRGMSEKKQEKGHNSKQWLQRHGWEILPHPAHSPDLAPSDFHLFGPLKRHLGGMAFETKMTSSVN